MLDIRLRKEIAMHKETKEASQLEIDKLRSTAERDSMNHQLVILNLEKKMQHELTKIQVGTINMNAIPIIAV